MGELVEKEETPMVAQTVTPMMMLQIAIEKGADLAQMEKLMDMSDRYEAGIARKAYVQAMSKFRATAPAIAKTRKVDYTTQKGRTSYSHAGLAESIEQVKSAMAECGLSHSWRTNQDNGQVAVMCCITHEMGHQECTSLSAPPDASGGKNSIQALASTVSYLERYTFFALAGLASAEMDDDGNLAGAKVEYLTPEQIANIEALAEEVGQQVRALCSHFNCKHIGVMPAKLYNSAIEALEGKRK